MWCVVYHRKKIGLEILALCTRCRKGLIAYNKSNGILAMTKHVEQDHASLFRWFREKLGLHSWPSFDFEPLTKRQQVALSSILGFFFLPTPFFEKSSNVKEVFGRCNVIHD
jgi:hypothetical protein